MHACSNSTTHVVLKHLKVIEKHKTKQKRKGGDPGPHAKQ